MKPLPSSRQEYAEWPRARVNIDYHIEVDHYYYSVPHPLVRETIQVRLTASTLECVRKDRRVAVHVRSYVRGKHTTLPEHMPKAHQRHRQWSPSGLLHWGEPSHAANQKIDRAAASRMMPVAFMVRVSASADPHSRPVS